MSESWELGDVDRFAAGAVGVPGQRVFYFQVVAGPLIVSLKCEKMQVAALAEAFSKLLVDLPPAEAGAAGQTEGTDLVTPVRPEWAVGSIGLGYETAADRIVVVFEEATQEDDTAKVRFNITRAQAAAFAHRSEELVKAGRPTCVLCSSPIDASGYTCHCYN